MLKFKSIRAFLNYAMNTNLISALLIAVVTLLTTQVPATAAQRASKTDIADWGTPSDPNGDCKFFRAPGELLISVPGSTGPHDLAADVDKFNAPRVLKPVSGDFVIQVKVEGRYAPGNKSTLPGRHSYIGAGLVVMANSNNVICLARAAFQRSSGEPLGYANFEKRVGGELERIGDVADHPLSTKGPAFLRLERRGQTIFGWISTDGDKWDALPPKVLPENWPHKLEVGVMAISTSAEVFNPRFSEFKLTKH